MANPVIVRFQVEGVADIKKAFRDVLDALVRAEQAQTSETKKQSQERTKSKKQELDEQTRETNKALKQQTADAKKALKQQETDQKAAYREWARARNVVNDDEVAAEQRKVAALKKKKKELADAAISEMQRESDARKRFAQAALGHGVMSGVRQIGGMAMGLAHSVLQAGGGFSIADAVQRSVAFKGQMADVANFGYNPTSENEKNRTRQDPKEIAKDARSTAIKYGYTEEAAAAGLMKFAKVSGDLDSARKLLQPLAELSRATASNLDDVADAAGNVSRAMETAGYKGEEKMRLTMQVMRGLGGQGKPGSIELVDMPKQIPKMIATAGQFSGDLAENILKMGAVAQAARGGGGAWNAQSAGTSVVALTDAFSKGARRNAFHSYGITLGDEKGGKIDFQKVMTEGVVAASSGKHGKAEQEILSDLFGSTFAKRGVREFSTIYDTAANAHGGGKTKEGEAAGRLAVSDYFNKMVKEAMLTEQKARELSAARLQEDDMKLAAMTARLRESVAEKILPRLMDLLPVIEKLNIDFVDIAARGLPAFVDLLKAVAGIADMIPKSIADHPIGAIIAASVARSALASALASGNPVVIGLAALGVSLWAAKVAIDDYFAKRDNDKNDFGADSRIGGAAKVAGERLRGTAGGQGSALEEQAEKKLADLKAVVAREEAAAKDDKGGALETADQKVDREHRAELLRENNETLKSLTDALKSYKTRTAGAEGPAPVTAPTHWTRTGGLTKDDLY